MATTYTYQREIYDQPAFLTYIKATLTTASSTYISNGAINIVFPSAITKATLDSLVANYTNLTLQINKTSFRNISIGNSTSNILLATSNYTGYFEDVSEYSSISTILFSDVPSSSNGFIIQFSTNGSNIDVSQSYTAKSGGYIQTYPTFGRYVRISYSNGNVAQSNFRLQTTYSYYKNISTGQFANDTLTDTSYLQISKNILAGRNASTMYENITSVNNKLSVNVPITAQGLLSTSSDVPLVQLDFSYLLNSETSQSNNVASGTVTLSNNFAVISSGAALNSVGSLNSKRFVKYRMGQGIIMSAFTIFSPGITGNTQLIGMGNSNDGIFYGYNGSNFGVMRRYNSIDTWILQNNWNIDKFDGTGPSGMNVNYQLGNNYIIQEQWPFGVVNFYIQEEKTGSRYLAHKLSVINNSLTTLTQTPVYPLIVSSSNSSSSSNVRIQLAGITASVEGIPRILGPRFGDDNTKSLNTNTYINILTIKNKTIFNSKPNYISLSLKNLAGGTDNRQAVVTLFRNAIVGGTKIFNDVDTTRSIAQTDFSGTTVTGGTQLHTFCLGNSTGLSQKFDDFEITLEPGDSITVCARIPTSSSTNVSVSLAWAEDQ
jgi:hypothetical protein